MTTAHERPPAGHIGFLETHRWVCIGVAALLLVAVGALVGSGVGYLLTKVVELVLADFTG